MFAAKICFYIRHHFSFFLMLIPGYDDYDYDYDFDTNTDIMHHLNNGKPIIFRKTRSRYEQSTNTGKRRLILYKALLNGQLVSRALIRGMCIIKNGFNPSKPFHRQSLIPINGDIEDDRIENLKWVPLLYSNFGPGAHPVFYN